MERNVDPEDKKPIEAKASIRKAEWDAAEILGVFTEAEKQELAEMLLPSRMWSYFAGFATCLILGVIVLITLILFR